MPPTFLGLSWRLHSQPRPPHPLPSSISRAYISTPNGRLELLSTLPSSLDSNSDKPPLFFLHGGFGAASVWIPWLLFFQSQGYACYALSLRSHGDSWLPGFWQMVWRTSMADLADDVVRGWEEVKRLEGERRGELLLCDSRLFMG